MKKTLFLFASLLILLYGCKNDPTSQELILKTQIETFGNLKQQAMDVHDEIMPKMSYLMELSGELKEKATELEDPVIESTELTDLRNTARDLRKVNDDMMIWMQDYSEKFPYGDPLPTTKEALEAKTPILQEEVNEIIALKKRTMEAMKTAQELLK